MDTRISTPALAALLVVLASAVGSGDEGTPTAADEALRRLLPPGWTAAPETFANADRVLPGARSWLCRLPAKGGYPHERIVLTDAGQVVHRSDGAAFLARARAARIEARREAAAWTVVDGGATGVGPLLDAFHQRAPGAGRDPGSALTAAIVLLDLLTYDGRFVAATVTARGTAGVEVDVDWEQGSGTWSFEERARWTFGFDRAGALSRLGKAQASFDVHLRK